MFINTKELISTSFKPAIIEGRINYKIVQRGKSKTNFKEYWFKLTGNLLFYFGLNSHGGIKGNEPVGVMVVEGMNVNADETGEALFAFIVTYLCEPEAKHVFSCRNTTSVHQWVTALRQASFEHLRIQMKILENKLESLGGKSIFNWNSEPPSSSHCPPVPPRKSKQNISNKETENCHVSEDLIKW